MESTTPLSQNQAWAHIQGPVVGVTQVKAMGKKAGWRRRGRRRESSSLLDEDKTSQPDTKDRGQLRTPAVRRNIKSQVHMQT